LFDFEKRGLIFMNFFPFSGLLRSLGWLQTDFSGQPIDLICKGQVDAGSTYDVVRKTWTFFSALSAKELKDAFAFQIYSRATSYTPATG
jgi:hypothetical protein